MMEYAILIGLVTLAAVTMQFLARRGVQTGVKGMNDLVLGEPPAPNLSVNASLNVAANSTITEAGDPTFRRVTTVGERVTGNSVNEATRLQVFQE